MTGGQNAVSALTLERLAATLLDEGVAAVIITTEDRSRVHRATLPKAVRVLGRFHIEDALAELKAAAGEEDAGPVKSPPRRRSASAVPSWPGRGNECYHYGMAKTQLGARVDEDVAELAKKRAADMGMSIGDYLARLVQDDASGLRARAVDAAARFLAEHQVVFDEAECAQRTSRGARAA
ncbi:hypothetical protein RJT17_36105 [Streptomyces sp. P5-A9]|uniref:hypothetical protein n=1 Tax=Streptomyces sp. P5-A9 TaxID=3071730 RepID=UPI002FCB281A